MNRPLFEIEGATGPEEMELLAATVSLGGTHVIGAAGAAQLRLWCAAPGAAGALLHYDQGVWMRRRDLTPLEALVLVELDGRRRRGGEPAAAKTVASGIEIRSGRFTSEGAVRCAKHRLAAKLDALGWSFLLQSDRRGYWLAPREAP